MSDQLEDQVGIPLSVQIEELVQERLEDGEYTTVRTASKQLNVKLTDIKEHLPAGAKLLPSKSGNLQDSKIQLNADLTEDEPEPEDEDDIAEQDAEDVEMVAKMLPKKERKKKVEKVQEPTYQVDEFGNQVLDEAGNPIPAEAIPEGEKVICAICGNPVRRNTIVRRGICPLCFRQLAKNVGSTAPKLEAMSDEEFEATLGGELGRRRTQEQRKAERTLTPEQFKELEANLIPVKELFAAGKEMGYGPGRVAQAVGGDRFRHDPVGGYGSVWTPYFAGARNGWYFDKDILNHWDDLKRPEKAPKPTKSASGKTAGVGRKGARGAEMVPVVEGGQEVTPEGMEETAEV
jgi:hypothetical protein